MVRTTPTPMAIRFESGLGMLDVNEKEDPNRYRPAIDGLTARAPSLAWWRQRRPGGRLRRLSNDMIVEGRNKIRGRVIRPLR